MQLVTTTHALEIRYGLKAAIRKIKEFGFDAYDASLYESMNPGKPLALTAYRDYAKEIREYADSIGINCVQSHAPFPRLMTHEDVEASIPMFIRAIEISAILGSEIIVIHPVKSFTLKENYELFYSKLLPVAKEYGIKIATENMFKREKDGFAITVPSTCGTPEEFVKYIDYANDENFVACLDIGHTTLNRSRPASEFIESLGHDRLKAIHVHNSDGYDDIHTIPFYGKADWDSICHSLAKINYTGYFTLESDKFLLRYPDEVLPTAIKLLMESGRYLIKLIEKYESEEQ